MDAWQENAPFCHAVFDMGQRNGVMTVLDLDLDFFQNGRKTDGFCGQSDGVSAWTETQVRGYLENNLKLDKNHKIKGKIVNKHHEAFDFWEQLIKNDLLTIPFSVDHVDAHGDLAFGFSKWWDVFFNRLVFNYFDKPVDFPKEGMNEGNYLCYAIAKQWLEKLNYIYNNTEKKCDGSDAFEGDDVFRLMWKDAEIGANFIQICKFAPALDAYDLMDADYTKALNKRCDYGKDIPFNRYAGSQFITNSNYDFINLAISPDYIVEDSKKNIDVIKEYMDLI